MFSTGVFRIRSNTRSSGVGTLGFWPWQRGVVGELSSVEELCADLWLEDATGHGVGDAGDEVAYVLSSVDPGARPGERPDRPSRARPSCLFSIFWHYERLVSRPPGSERRRGSAGQGFARFWRVSGSGVRVHGSRRVLIVGVLFDCR